MALNPETVRTIVGILGNIISCFLFLAPIPTFMKIVKAKSVLAFKPDPYLATVFNCAMWMLYGMPFVHPDSLLIITINAIGFVVEITYITFYFIYADKTKCSKMLLALLVEVVILFAVVVITLMCFNGTKSRSTFVGILCIFLNIMMYASPLTVMKEVIRTKSVKYMPFFLSLANLLNGIVWTIYSLTKFDVNILIPNGLGTISGLVQLLLIALYYKSTNWDEDDTIQTDIELQK